MSEELIRSLNKRIEELTTENAAIKQEVITRRKAAQGAKKDAESLKEQVDALAAERDKWKQQAEATPAETAKRIKELEGQVKRAGVKEKFAEVASGLAEKVNLDVLFNNVGFDPTSEGSEQANTSELVAAWRESHPYLFKAPSESLSQGAGPDGPKRPPLTPSVPTGRGAPDLNGGFFTVSRSREASDSNWMRQNQAKLAEAAKQGTVRWVD